MRRRRIPILPLLAVALTATVAAAATFGVTRYRAPAEVPLVVAAADRHRCGLAMVARTEYEPGGAMTTTRRAGTAGHDTPSRRNFVVGITVIAIVALGVRVAWVLIARRDFELHGDDFFYHWQANALADGMGFLNPFTWKALGRIEPSAAHPPLYSMYLGVFSWLGFTSALAHRLASCLLGAAAVVVVGLVGRKIAGDRAGLIGAGIAAVYPQLWINDGMLVSESMYILMIAITLLLAYRLW